MTTSPRQAFERELEFARRLAFSLLRTRRRFIESLEAQTVALGGLWRCALRHHALPPEEFHLLACRYVRGSVADHLRAADWRGRQGRAAAPEALRVEYEDELHGLPEADDSVEQLQLLRAACRTLPRAERRVISARLLRSPPLTAVALARRMGVTAGRVSQISSQAASRLRGKLRAV